MVGRSLLSRAKKKFHAETRRRGEYPRDSGNERHCGEARKDNRAYLRASASPRETLSLNLA